MTSATSWYLFRECNVYCEIYSSEQTGWHRSGMNKGVPPGDPVTAIMKNASTCTNTQPRCLCTGAQLMQHVLGSKVERHSREYGRRQKEAFVDKACRYSQPGK